ncbi:MAG: FkbM family methyltransferase [Patescibacteria group bacterium]|nr:FkbM family methyltransferase [Patescibacteria group bacterium]
MYTREYFLGEDQDGNPTGLSVEGLQEFKAGKIRFIDEQILSRINFKNRNVLDLGFGRGEALKYALERKAKKAIGVDFSFDSKIIAEEMLRHYQLQADLYCQDVLLFLKQYQKLYTNLKIDIILMLDFVEHVPREEMVQILGLLGKIMSEKSILAINTPVYKVDNDVIKEGLKDKARDATDEYKITIGMHCNRYSKKSLADFMKENGFSALSGHFFAPNHLGLRKWKNAFETGLPIYPELKKEYFEPALKLADFGKPTFFFKVKSWFLKIIHLLMPPFIILMLAKFLFLFQKKENKLYQYYPKWYRIKGGKLKGRLFFVDPHDGYWQQEVLEGQYDRFFFDFLDKYDLKGKTIFDIGAHIGYHSMYFAELVGDKGKVFSFEPNTFNLKRMQKILKANKDLSSRIKIFNIAIGKQSGKINFGYSPEIDCGYSCGGYIEGAETPYTKNDYQTVNFKKTIVRQTSLDNITKDLKVNHQPFLIKIDVEGAEYLILQGAKKFIIKNKPIFLIEIHNLYNILEVYRFLIEHKYDIKLLNETTNCRCFIAAFPRGKDE